VIGERSTISLSKGDAKTPLPCSAIVEMSLRASNSTHGAPDPNRVVDVRTKLRASNCKRSY
jgi:hypothetical protein